MKRIINDRWKSGMGISMNDGCVYVYVYMNDEYMMLLWF